MDFILYSARIRSIVSHRLGKTNRKFPMKDLHDFDFENFVAQSCILNDKNINFVTYLSFGSFKYCK